MENMVGNKFNKLKVVSLNRKDRSGIYWNCLCDCGNTSVVSQSALVRGATKSCGCSRKKNSTKSLQKLYTKEWSSWENMHQRCYNENSDSYSDYGLNGIEICDRWNRNAGGSFENFYSDMGERPAGTTLERLDVNGNYCPENCTWATRATQSWNRNKFSNNTSGQTGVYFHKKIGKWFAKIGVGGKQIHLGYFSSIDDAVQARKSAEIKYYGNVKEDQGKGP